MNDLSWFLYLADVLPNAATAFSFFGFLLMFGFGMCAFFYPAWHHDFGRNKNPLSKKMHGTFISLTVLFGIGWFICFFIPSKETIYLIAGSEAGEAVVTSETGQEIINDIHEIIKHQLGKLKAPKE